MMLVTSIHELSSWMLGLITDCPDCDFSWLTWLLRWYAVEQLVEALRYKPEGRGFFSLWGPAALRRLDQLSL
jgi:hypothetical protein